MRFVGAAYSDDDNGDGDGRVLFTPSSPAAAPHMSAAAPHMPTADEAAADESAADAQSRVLLRFRTRMFLALTEI